MSQAFRCDACGEYADGQANEVAYQVHVPNTDGSERLYGDTMTVCFDCVLKVGEALKGLGLPWKPDEAI